MSLPDSEEDYKDMLDDYNNWPDDLDIEEITPKFVIGEEVWIILDLRAPPIKRKVLSYIRVDKFSEPSSYNFRLNHKTVTIPYTRTFKTETEAWEVLKLLIEENYKYILATENKKLEDFTKEYNKFKESIEEIP